MKNEKIYVLMVCNYYGNEWENIGVYSTLEEARNEGKNTLIDNLYDTYIIYIYEKIGNKYEYISFYGDEDDELEDDEELLEDDEELLED